MTGPQPPRELASAVHRAWVSFVVSGDPGRPAYDLGRRPVTHLGERLGVEGDPGGDERRLWKGIRRPRMLRALPSSSRAREEPLDQ
ncbi:MAG TPA: hypothetical protein VKY90_18730 [Candidatus Dormibacteraeota bacterium]|nr:hypothetical protein [Candidatus Dormibacteraeota bacterium]